MAEGMEHQPIALQSKRLQPFAEQFTNAGTDLAAVARDACG
jgi:hypothetical protein